MGRDGARSRPARRIGGETIHPALVEAALATEPGVADCAVLALPGRDGAEVVTACVEPLAGTTRDRTRLAAVLAGALPHAARPGAIRVVDRLPRAPSGKLSKPRLRRMLLDGPSRDGD